MEYTRRTKLHVVDAAGWTTVLQQPRGTRVGTPASEAQRLWVEL